MIRCFLYVCCVLFYVYCYVCNLRSILSFFIFVFNGLDPHPRPSRRLPHSPSPCPPFLPSTTYAYLPSLHESLSLSPSLPPRQGRRHPPHHGLPTHRPGDQYPNQRRRAGLLLQILHEPHVDLAPAVLPPPWLLPATRAGADGGDWDHRLEDRAVWAHVGCGVRHGQLPPDRRIFLQL